MPGHLSLLRSVFTLREAMAIETIGNYQLHLFAYELPGSGKWDPFFTIRKFDMEAADFKCVLEDHHASEEVFATYDEAIDEARRVGSAMIETGKF
ncbi:MAG: hypothetical protein V7606_2611 [Burkholderiales bacterium]|jgi:hypothetical protein